MIEKLQFLKFFNARKAEGMIDTPSSGLSFSILFDYPDAPESYMPFRAVGKKGKSNLYSIIAPNLSHSDLALLSRLKAQLVSLLVEEEERNPGINLEYARRASLGMVSAYSTSESKQLLAELLAHDTAGYGPFSLLMEDAKNIEEIIVNDPYSRISIYHSSYGYCNTNIQFRGEREFRYMLNKMIERTGKELNSINPVIDAQLPEGSRVHAQISPYSVRGTSASIRLAGNKGLDLVSLIRKGALSAEEAAYLWLAIESGSNIIIAGAPSSGKTTLLSALCTLIGKDHRVITVEEDVNEIKIGEFLPNNVALQGSSGRHSVKIGDQVINALHLRPDMLIVGEVRGEETREVFFGANVGVPFATTMHSNSDSNSLISRLTSKPMSVEIQSLSELDLAVITALNERNERKVEKVIEYKWVAKGELEPGDSNTQGFLALEVFAGGKLSESIKDSKILSNYARVSLSNFGTALKEMKRRATFLNKLVSSGVEGAAAIEQLRNFGAVSWK
ncbi:MAG: type II/IV secretion system ATPase subunit [Candidatus Micrarchaeia archaeon]